MMEKSGLRMANTKELYSASQLEQVNLGVSVSDKPKILAVDDEELNLDIIAEDLTTDGYEVVTASNGAIALQKLEENQDIDVIVLDRMMPNMSGMEVLAKVKSDKRFKDIPVVIQTAVASNEQVMEGIQAGAYYYLVKPYGGAMLLSIVKAALNDSNDKRTMKAIVREQKCALGLMEQSRFRFRTLEEAKNLAYFISGCFPDPEMVVYGLGEILINAVEHGNLGITYFEKKELLFERKWQQEVERRLTLPENIKKYVHLTFEATDKAITLHVKDCGKGFDWQKYLQISPDRATDPHGRGIATACMISFHKLEYLGDGNEAVCVVNLSQ